MKESDRWVEARERQRHSEAQTSHFKELFKKRHAKSLLVGGLVFGGLLVGYWASLAWIPLWIQDLLHSGGTAGTGNERGIATMYQGISAMLGCSLAGVFSNWIGRRNTIIWSSLGCFAASALLFLTNTGFSTVIYLEASLLGFFIGMIQAVMYIYLPELFPTLIRASGTGFCLNVGRFVTAVAVFYVGDLLKLVDSHNLAKNWLGNGALSSYGVAAFLFAIAYLVSVAAAFFGDETKDRPLLEE
jgi:MFS family permease